MTDATEGAVLPQDDADAHAQVDIRSPVARTSRGVSGVGSDVGSSGVTGGVGDVGDGGSASATTAARDELMAGMSVETGTGGQDAGVGAAHGDADSAGDGGPGAGVPTAGSVADSDAGSEGGDDVGELGAGAPRASRPRLRRRRKKKRAKQSDAEALASMLSMTKSVGAASSVTGASSFGGSMLDDGRSVMSNATSVTRGGSSALEPGPVGRRIEAALQFSFDATVVKVTNVSHWFHMVSLMGNRNVRLRKVTCSETSKLWTAQIMTMQMDVNTGRMRPKLFTIGSTFKTETKALKACEDAATRRDRGPPPPEVDGLDSALSVGFGSSFRGDMSVDDGAASVATNPRMARLRGMQSSSRSVMSTASVSSVGSRSSKLSSRKGRRKGKKQGPPYLETHYTVLVVSELFEHKTLREQLTMVYRVLHEQLWVPLPDDTPVEWDSQRKGYSAVGKCVRDLPEWSGYPWNIFVQCQTPAQWAAHRAAKARTRSGSVTSAAASKAGRGVVPWEMSSQRTPLKAPRGLPIVGPGAVTDAALASDASLFLRRMDMDAGFVPAGEVQQLADSKIPTSLEALQEAIVAAHQDLKLQRQVYKARRAAMAKAEEVWNDAGFEVDSKGHIIGFKQSTDGEDAQAGNAQDGDGKEDAGKTGKKGKGKGKGKGGQSGRLQSSALGGHVSAAAENKEKAAKAAKAKAAKAKAKAKAKAAHKSDAEKRLERTMAAVYGNNSDKERPDLKFRRMRRQQTIAARSLQRIYRQHMIYDVLRRMRRRDRTATVLARIWRGYVARCFVAEMHAILERSAILGQKIYRGWVDRRFVKAHRRKLNGAAVEIQRVVRGWKGRRWWQFVFHNSKAAVQVQRVIRGFIARAEARHRRRVKHFHEVVIPAAIRIQAQYRRRLAIKVVAERRAYVYHVKVEVPSATHIASVWRMHAAVKRKKRLRLERWAATQIQRIARGMGHQARYQAALKLHYDTLAADKIARLVRVWYSKRLLRHRAAHKYKTEKMIPAATYLQKFYRGAAVRRVVRRMRLRLKSAKVLQAAWRNSLAVRAARERWRVLRQQFVYRTATKIQAAWRGMAARKRAEFERHRQAAAQIKPARQIQNWWRGRAARRAFVKVLRISRIRLMRDEMNEVRTDCETITEDMEDIRIDIENRQKAHKKYIRQLKALRRWRDEMRRRMPVVEEEMEKLTEEDMNAGWGEAYEREFSYTTEAIQMSAEEVAGKKLQQRECELQIESLRVELDDLETDMDHELTRELEVTERLRRTEIELCEELWMARERREVARQKTRWAIRGVRKAVIKREYEARRNKAVDDEIEQRGGLAAMGIWDDEVDADEEMARVLEGTKPYEKPKSVFGLTGFRKPQGRWSTPGAVALKNALADPMEAPRPPPPGAEETAAQREADEQAEAKRAWAQTKKALQFIARTVEKPASRFATDASLDHEVGAVAAGGGKAGGKGGKGAPLPQVGVPPHMNKTRVAFAGPAQARGEAPPRPPSPLTGYARAHRRASLSSTASTSSLGRMGGRYGKRASARARALARIKLPSSAPSLSTVLHNAGGFGGLSGVAMGGAGLFPESKLGAEAAVSQPRGLMLSNTSINVQRRLKRSAFLTDFRKQLDDTAAASERVRVRTEGARPAPAVARTFDAVIADTHALIQDLSFDTRHPKDDPRGRTAADLARAAAAAASAAGAE